MKNHRAHLAVSGFNGELYSVGGMGMSIIFSFICFCYWKAVNVISANVLQVEQKRVMTHTYHRLKSSIH